MSRITRSRKRGQALVEFAIVLPIFLLVVLLIFDAGRAIYFYSAIHNAAREGARYGIIHQDTVKIQNVTRQKAVGLVINPVVTITTNTVTVAISYPFTTITPLLDRLIGSSPLLLHTQATMYYEP